jgi:hypothetical protein
MPYIHLLADFLIDGNSQGHFCFCIRCKTAQQAKAHCEVLDWQLDEDQGEIISAKFASLFFLLSLLSNSFNCF